VPAAVRCSPRLCSLLERALPHGDLGDRFVYRSIPMFPVKVGLRRSGSRAEIPIGPAQTGVFVAERVLFRRPLFVVTAARPLAAGVTALAMLFAITEPTAFRRNIFQIAGTRPRAGAALRRDIISLSGEPFVPFIGR
jgi:hypothetical protein